MVTHLRSVRCLVRCALGCLPILLAAITQQTLAAPPNVIVFLVDDMGATDLACYGSKYYRSPNVDRLAREGMRFTQAYAACPVCSPTRAALLTGKYPARLRLTDYIPGQDNKPEHRLLRPEFRQELPLEEVTIAELLAQAGYTTGTIGKWHLGDKGYEATRQGFSLAIGGGPWGSVKSYFAPFLLRDGQPLPGLGDASEGEYLNDRLAAEAEKFLDANRAQPFFLYLPHYAVHTPLMAKAEQIAHFEPVPQQGLQRNSIYAAMVESLDESLGRVLRKLDELKLAENTLVIFTSDNGGLATVEGRATPATNNAPLREGKGYLYEGGIRVPLVVRWPAQVKAGTTCETPVSSQDLFATIAAAANVAKNKIAHDVDGVDLTPLLRQSGPVEREALYWHYPHYSPQGGKPGGAIREGNWKLIEFYEQQRRELFNLADDPSENVNLSEKQPERVTAMAAKLDSWRKSVGAEMTKPNPDFVPDSQGNDGILLLPGRTANVHGVMLRYEPLPHKATLGFWVRLDDWVSWDFRISRPGTFDVEILQGCGPGSGGSQVDFTIGEQTLTTTVVETKGFQDFVPRKIGSLKLPRAGDYTLAVKPRTKPRAAVMDLRQVRFIPQESAE